MNFIVDFFLPILLEPPDGISGAFFCLWRINKGVLLVDDLLLPNRLKFLTLYRYPLLRFLLDVDYRPGFKVG